MTHENYIEFLAAKALTALDAEDERALATHLASCNDCRSEINAWENAAALLALDATPLEPSPRVRERIIASVRSEDRTSKFLSDRASDNGEPGNVLNFASQPRNAWASLGSFGAIAAIIVFAGVLVGLMLLWQKNRSLQNQLAQASERSTQLQTELAQQHAMGQLLTSPDARMAKLKGTDVAPGAHAMLAYDKTGHAMLMATGLPKAPEGMAYQLWYIKDNKKMAGKVFTLDAAGNATMEDQIPAAARDAGTFAVTLEPKSGVQVPTGSIYLLSSA